jgi:hypothetical protein
VETGAGVTPTAGWYPNPDGTGTVRWWDGQQWTDYIEHPGNVRRPDDQTGFPPPVQPVLGAPSLMTQGSAAARKDATALTFDAKLFGAGLGAALFAIIGSFAPWATISVYELTATVSGTEGGRDGWITLVVSLIAGALLIWGYRRTARGPLIGAIVFGVIALGVGILDSVDISATISSRLSRVNASASIDWGLVLVDLGSVVFVAACFMLLSRSKSNRKVPAG